LRTAKDVNYGPWLVIDWSKSTYLSFGSNVEEGPISCNEMMSNASGLILYNVRMYIIGTPKPILTYSHVNLTTKNVFGLLIVVVSIPCGSRNNSVEPCCEVGGRSLSLCLNGVEIGDDSSLSLWDGDVLMACALDNGERNNLGH
jgi:hypothetical protein